MLAVVCLPWFAVATASVLPSHVDANISEIPMAQLPSTLRGATASFGQVAKFNGGDVALLLDVRRSDQINTDSSTVTVTLDDVPVVTLSVAQLLMQPTIELGAPPAGFHRVAIATHLRIDKLDSCDPDFRNQAWLVVDVHSHWRMTLNQQSQSYQDFLDRWFARKKPVTIAFGQQPNQSAAAQDIVAYIQIDNALRRYGLNVRRVASGSADVVVHVDPSMPRDTSVIAQRDGALWIQAQSAQRLATAAQVLADPSLLAACADWPCEFGDIAISNASEINAESQSVMTIGDQFVDGFRAAGPGQHVMTMRWSKPSDVNILAGSELQLELRAPLHIAAGRHIQMDVAIADIVVETFDIHEGANSIRLPLPLQQSRLGSTAINLVINNSEPAGKTCGPDESDLWLWIDPRSRLVVPREIIAYAGIASFFRRLTGRPVLAIDGNVTWQDAEPLATMLAPIASRFGNQIWTAIPSCLQSSTTTVLAASSTPCLQLHSSSAVAQDVATLVGAASRAPYKSTRQSMMSLRDGNSLEIWSAEVSPPAPDFSSLLTSAAMSSSDNWVSLGVATKVGTPTTSVSAVVTSTPDAPVLEGQRAKRRKYFTWMWSGLAMLVLVGLARVVSQGRDGSSHG
jgi:hypothetical protein